MDVIILCSSQRHGWSNSKQNISGFSLIELLATLAVVSILIAESIPGLNAMLAQERSTSLTNKLAGTLAYARSEAITKHQTVIACQSTNSSTCDKSGKWQNGWIVFIDKNRNKQRDATDTLLRVYSTVNNGTQAIFKGSAGIKYYIKYKPNGTAHPNGSFLICNPDIGIGKALIMSHSGRLRLSKKQTDGSAVTCS